MKITLPHIFSQLKPDYKSVLLGSNTNKVFNLYDYGCLLMKLCEVLNYYGHPILPLELNKKLTENGGFVNGGEYVHGTIARLYPDLTETRTVTPTELTDVQINEIKAAIDQGFPVIIELDYNPKTVARDMHFVMIINYNPQDENDFTIVDPLGGRVISLKEYLAWFKPSARKTIEQYIIYGGDVPTTPMVDVPTPETPNTNTMSSGIMVDPAQNELNVKMATQYKEVVNYLELGKPPEDALFEDVRRVIAGIKSRVTDLENKKIEAEKQVAKLPITISGLETKIASLEEQLLNTNKIHKAELDTLKNTQPNADKVLAAYKEANGELQRKLDARDKEIFELKNSIVDIQVEENNKVEQVDQTKIASTKKSGNIFMTIINFFSKLES